MSELEARAVAASATHDSPSRSRPSFALTGACIFIGLLVLAAIWPALLATDDPNRIAPIDAFEPPSLAHWFGTDESGRDLYSRTVFGTAPSLLIGLSATAIGLTGGLVLGILGGFGGRATAFAVARVNEVLFAFPGLLLALLVIVLFGPGVLTATIAVGLSTVPGYARIIRGELLRLRESGFVEAARVLGHHPVRIATRHIMPNALLPVAVLATLGIGQAIVWASALSYLGLGALPPAAEWGAMLSAGRTYISSAWWMTVFPGAMIVGTTIATTVVGRAVSARSGVAR